MRSIAAELTGIFSIISWNRVSTGLAEVSLLILQMVSPTINKLLLSDLFMSELSNSGEAGVPSACGHGIVPFLGSQILGVSRPALCHWCSSPFKLHCLNTVLTDQTLISLFNSYFHEVFKHIFFKCLVQCTFFRRGYMSIHTSRQYDNNWTVYSSSARSIL